MQGPIQMATMALQNVVITGFREDKKTGDWSADLAYVGGRESVKLIDKSQREKLPVGKFGTVILEMASKQSIQDYKDGQFISNGWRSDILMDFREGNVTPTFGNNSLKMTVAK